MHLSGRIENNPDYVLLKQYYSKEDVKRIIESGIPINQVDVVPSLMVPPGQGCEDLATQGLAGLADVSLFDVPLSTIGTKNTQTVGLWQTIPDLFTPKASQPQVQTAVTPTPRQDPALDWVEQNWLLIAAGLGGLLLLSMATKK
jgi:hypothetical protein